VVWSGVVRLTGAPVRGRQILRWSVLSLGRRLRITLPGGELPPGVVTAREPPPVVSHTWGQQAFHFQLSAREGAGTVLLMTNTFPAAMKAQRDSEGSWQHCRAALQVQLTALARYLEGRP
jgi:hypothetical protein